MYIGNIVNIFKIRICIFSSSSIVEISQGYQCPKRWANWGSHMPVANAYGKCLWQMPAQCIYGICTDKCPKYNRVSEANIQYTSIYHTCPYMEHRFVHNIVQSLTLSWYRDSEACNNIWNYMASFEGPGKSWTSFSHLEVMKVSHVEYIYI